MPEELNQIIPQANRGIGLKVLGGTLALSELLAGCATQSSSLEQLQQSKDRIDQMIDSRMSFHSSPGLLPQNQEQKQRTGRAKVVQEKIKSHVTAVSRYSRDGNSFYFYHGDDYTVPSKDQLDVMWDFIRSQNIITSGFRPLNEAHFFIGPWGKDVGTFTIPIVGDVFVNTTTHAGVSDAFSTEFCQVLLPESTSLFSVAHDEQEIACNKFGVAMAYIKLGDPYEKYEEKAIRKGLFGTGRTLEWGVYSKRSYDFLLSHYNEKFRENQNLAMSDYIAELVIKRTGTPYQTKIREEKIAALSGQLLPIVIKKPGFWGSLDTAARMLKNGSVV